MRPLLTLAFALLLYPISALGQRDNGSDADVLGRALDYFAGGKYHEALTLMITLDKKYRLNPRIKAYIGLCYYHEWEYVSAIKYLDEALPSLTVYAPQERGVYYNALAESYFKLEQYDKAIPLYENKLIVCVDAEKGDALYKIGICHMQKEDWEKASEYLNSALSYYQRFQSSENLKARIAQTERMIKGCESYIERQSDGLLNECENSTVSH